MQANEWRRDWAHLETDSAAILYHHRKSRSRRVLVCDLKHSENIYPQNPQTRNSNRTGEEEKGKKDMNRFYMKSLPVMSKILFIHPHTYITHIILLGLKIPY